MNYPWLDEYLLNKCGAHKDFKVEWQWNRYMIRGKLFAAICKDKEQRPIITIKCEPEFGRLLRDTYPDITAGYYMNKEHWNSVQLSGGVPDEVIKQMIDMAYHLILSSFSKKVQHEIANG